jgi:hypothetical protein
MPNWVPMPMPMSAWANGAGQVHRGGEYEQADQVRLVHLASRHFPQVLSIM